MTSEAVTIHDDLQAIMVGLHDMETQLESLLVQTRTSPLAEELPRLLTAMATLEQTVRVGTPRPRGSRRGRFTQGFVFVLSLTLGFVGGWWTFASPLAERLAREVDEVLVRDYKTFPPPTRQRLDTVYRQHGLPSPGTR